MKKSFEQYIGRAVKDAETAQGFCAHADVPFGTGLEENKKLLCGVFQNAADFVCKAFHSESLPQMEGYVFYLSELIDDNALSEHVLHALLRPSPAADADANTAAVDLACKRMDSAGEVKKERMLHPAVRAVVDGCAAILFQGCGEALLVDLQKRTARDIPQPQYEASVFGPQQAFIEDSKINLSMVRNIIRSPMLAVEQYTPKSPVKTKIYLLYLNGKADADVLRTLRGRLDAMQVDLVLDSALIKGYISDKGSFPFDTVGLIERPDTAAAKIMEGKIALVCDGSPFVLTVPYLFAEEFHRSEDYYMPAFFASFGRMLRFASFLITLLLAPIYIAASTFHQELFPLTLLITASSSKENTPFPTLMEALLMMSIFDILREGGIRAPRPVGQTVSFIGALIIGTAAVDAGVFSAPMVIITSLSGITALLNYSLKSETIFFRTLFLVSSGFIGFLGIETTAIVMLIRLCGMQSFGTSFLSPAAPFNGKAFFRDTLIRFPVRMLSLLWNTTRGAASSGN